MRPNLQLSTRESLESFAPSDAESSMPGLSTQTPERGRVFGREHQRIARGRREGGGGGAATIKLRYRVQEEIEVIKSNAGVISVSFY